MQHLLTIVLIVLGIVSLTQAQGTYTNPILDSNGADPWVIQNDGWYYLMYSTNTNIMLYRSKVLTDWNDADSKTLFDPPNGTAYSTDLWAPEIHFIDGLWYVIFTADPYEDMPPPEQDKFCTFDCPAVNHRYVSCKAQYISKPLKAMARGPPPTRFPEVGCQSM